MREMWKDIKGYEGFYQVSNTGKILSLDRNTTNGKIRKLQTSNNGYLSVTLCKNGIITRKSIHRLVAETFLPNPYCLPQINHKDEDKTNNLVCINDDGSVDLEKSNLEWCTQLYNNRYGNHSLNISKSRRKAVIQFDINGNEIKSFDSPITASNETNIPYSSIVGNCNGSQHTAGGYIWKYKKDAV